MRQSDADYNETVAVDEAVKVERYEGIVKGSPEDKAVDAGFAVEMAACDWANAESPAERREAEDKLFEATREYQRLASIAWPCE
jgi:hypothetical protein